MSGLCCNGIVMSEFSPHTCFYPLNQLSISLIFTVQLTNHINQNNEIQQCLFAAIFLLLGFVVQSIGDVVRF